MKFLVSLLTLVFFSLSNRKDLKDIELGIKVKDVNEQYLLYDSRENHKIGKASYELSYQKRGFYKLKTYVKVKTQLGRNYLKEYLEFSNEVILDKYFKIVRFKGYVKKNGIKKERNGYYKKPYFYIYATEKDVIYDLPGGIFSSFIVYYLASHADFRNHSIYEYEFFNLINLEIEKEYMIYQKKKKYKQMHNLQDNKERIVKKYKIQNVGTKTYWIYYYTNENELIQKIDFNGLVIWKNINF